MKPFLFVGRLPASKSILNRLHVVRSYFPNLQIRGDSCCDDVVAMNRSVSTLLAQEHGRPPQAFSVEVNAESAGTVLRFLALRLARIPGRHVIRGQSRLFERPQEELIKILRQLGVAGRLHKDFMEIEGDGWRMHGDTLLVPIQRSSQFASGVLLNSWELPFDLYVSLGGQKVSEGYWRMSVRLAEQLGMRLEFWDGDFRVPRNQRVNRFEVLAESDASSAFAIAAVASVSGSANILDFPKPGLQPDVEFVSILERMGARVHRTNSDLKVERASRLNGVAVNLRHMPDLFPVLAALCGLANGESELYGAPHLIHKESNRITQMAGLLRALGRVVEIKEDGLTIRGELKADRSLPPFDCDNDHRLAFAAAVIKAAGFVFAIHNREVVSKSFPEFWGILGFDQ